MSAHVNCCESPLLFTSILWTQVFGVVGSQQTAGFNKNGAFIGTASVKVKGIANSSGVMWDTYDLVHPAKERDALFVATLLKETVGQTKGTCPNPGAACTTDTECTFGEFVGTESDLTAKALQTGVCLIGPPRVCEVAGWCPLEAEQTVPTIDDVRKWTVFIRIDGSFPSLDASRAFSTVGDDIALTQYKNLFFIQDIVAAASPDDPCILPKFTDGVSDAMEPVCSDAAFKASAEKGTVILMNVNYGTSKVRACGERGGRRRSARKVVVSLTQYWSLVSIGPVFAK